MSKSSRNPKIRMALIREKVSKTRYWARNVSVEKPPSIGVRSVAETKHSTSAVSESEDAKNAPSAIQNVPMRPKQPSSIRVDTGFMLRLMLNAESTRMMTRVAEDTKIANGTKRVRSEALSTL